MKSNVLKIGAVSIALLAPIGAQAQGIVGGAANGADQGNAAAAPVGAVVGGTVSAVAGGLLGVDQRPRFHEYVVREHRPSYRYSDDVRVGVVLPSDGVQYYDVPSEYGVRGERYTIVNDQTVLVDPRTHQVIQVLD
jgi:hypothetical protein